MSFTPNGGLVINESSEDFDFRVKSNSNDHMLFVDGGNNVVCVGGTTAETGDHFEVISADTTTNLRIRNTNAGSAAPAIIFDKSSGSPADDDEVGLLNFVGQDSANNAEVYAQIVGIAADVTAGTEDGKITIGTKVSGSFDTTMTITDGRIGIGESAPGSQLQITSNTSGVNAVLSVKNAQSNRESRIQLLDESDQGGMVLNYDNGGNSATIQNAVNGALAIYLGGTGDANKLDDYEEGTFTPAFAGSGGNPTVNYNTVVGIYTKIGNLVHIEIRLITNSVSGGSGNISITGLPFASRNNNGVAGGFTKAFVYNWATDPEVFLTGGSTSVAIYSSDVNNAQSQVSHLNTGGPGNYTTISGAYLI